MDMAIEQIQAGFAARITGIDLTGPISPPDQDKMKAATRTYAVLVFPGQAVSDEQQQQFSTLFGTIEDKTGGYIPDPKGERLSRGMNDISNLDTDNKLLAWDSRQRLFNLANRLWHSDSSYRAIPAKFSLLSGRQVPTNGGGNTEFADMCAAYSALNPQTLSEIEDLVCEHSLIHSRGILGFETLDSEKEMFRPVRQRLVRRHQVTGRKSLYLSAHAGSIIGWPLPEAKILLHDLTEHATQRQFVYSHRWQNNDLVMWDNRCTMHRARPFDAAQVRDMRRTTIAGDEMTVEQAI